MRSATLSRVSISLRRNATGLFSITGGNIYTKCQHAGFNLCANHFIDGFL